MEYRGYSAAGRSDGKGWLGAALGVVSLCEVVGLFKDVDPSLLPLSRTCPAEQFLCLVNPFAPLLASRGSVPHNGEVSETRTRPRSRP